MLWIRLGRILVCTMDSCGALVLVKPILNIGFEHDLTEEDLCEISPNDECGQLLKKLESVWEKYENQYNVVSTWKIIIETFWREFSIGGILLIPLICVRIAQPLLLKQIVLMINDSNVPSHSGYFYVIGLGLASIIQSILHQQYYFRSTRTGIHVRTALSAIIYKRLLSLPATTMINTTAGQVINLIANDAGKFEELSISLHQIWAAPLEAIIVFVLIWLNIGIPALFGYCFLLLLVPLQLLFSRKFVKYKKDTIKWTDQRIKVINEILSGCQIVKMYRWEEALENFVHDSRKNEVQSIRKASRLRAINISAYFSSLPLVSLATFGGSWLMGQTLSPATIFSISAFFNNIRYPLTTGLPFAIEKLSESMVAATRISQFMGLSKKCPLKSVQKHPESDHGGELGSIKMNGATFTWGSSESTELKRINLDITNGSLVGVIGPVGSCKSSLLAAILGEMSLTQGTSDVFGKIAYVPQTPWIFSGTIRENILFYKSFDNDKYEHVLKCCELIGDLHSLSAGDSTVIGENGSNLSGGQKARLSLARALYTEADIYLFDNPLAPIDRHVSNKIFKQCISNEGILRKKTRLLVTHQLQFLTQFDHCVLLDNGEIEKQGSFEDLVTLDKIQRSYENHQYQINETKEIDQNDDSNVKEYDSPHSLEKVDDNSIIRDEASFTGTVNVSIWSKLFTTVAGWIGLCLLILLMLLGEAVYDASNKWLSIWASKSNSEQRERKYPCVYLGLVMGSCILALIRADYFFYLILRGASALHNNMLKGVLYSSLRFFEGNPVGRILNRFSKDQAIVDELLPMTFFDAFQSLVLSLGCVVIVATTNAWVLLILVPIIPIFLWLRRYYLKSSRSLKRLESIRRSPIYALFSSTMSGLMTIRSFNVQDDLTNTFIAKSNAHSLVYFILDCSGRWFGLRLDLLTCSLTFLTAILSISLRNKMDPSSVALALSYCITLTGLFQWAVRQSAETENFMTSAERINEYSQLPSESGFYQGKSEVPINWPIEGKIEFRDYKLKYRPELKPVLKGISLKVTPRNKIGIIGRTGAGKSSMFQGLFRLIDQSLTEGRIVIDDVDINSISLNDLRSVFNIIPQSPVLFSNTLRYNLDPFKRYTDDQLWNVLEAVQLKTKIDGFKDKLGIQIAEFGSNFSVGECQLICVARAILKPSKILLIDEATAHVDTHTDGIIQQVIREKFVNQTILIIAHRLNTVVDSDKIVVLSNGLVLKHGTPDELLIDSETASSF